MPTYYEILNVQPTATGAEIESAYETQYNKWRRLVTHYDPTVVEEANRALRVLEQIHTTLADPAKRAVYDGSLNIGGLADPDAILQMTPPPPPPPRHLQPAPPAPAAPRVDAWICPRCQTPNAIGMRHCAKCGQQIGRDCPNCGKIVAVADRFCPYCGVEVEQQRLRQLQAQIETETEEIQRLERVPDYVGRLTGRGSSRELYESLERSVGCLTRGMVSLGSLTVAGVIGWLCLAASPGSPGLAVGAFFIALFIAGVWFDNLAIKPEIERRVEAHRQRIASLEQEMKQIQASGGHSV